MVDPLVSASVGEVVKAGGGVLSRLLGPTADQMGKQLQQWYDGKHVARVVRRADQKANTAAGSIPMRVAAEVFEKAQWAENEFVVEYLSGVLATARTAEGKDDGAISWTALVGRMSADQLRLHYVLYRAMRGIRSGQEWPTLTAAFEDPVVVTYVELSNVMDIPLSEEGMARLLDSMYGLVHEDLIEGMSHGTANFLNENRPDQTFPDMGGGYIIATGTARGASLFLHAHGLGNLWAASMFDANQDLDVEWPEGAAVPPVNIIGLSSYNNVPPGTRDTVAPQIE